MIINKKKPKHYNSALPSGKENDKCRKIRTGAVCEICIKGVRTLSCCGCSICGAVGAPRLLKKKSEIVRGKGAAEVGEKE